MGLYVVALIATGGWIQRRSLEAEIAEQRSDLANFASELAAQLEREVARAVGIVNGLAATVVINPELTSESFANFASHVARTNEDLVSVAVSPGMVVRNVYPLDRAERVIGLNMLEDPDVSPLSELAVSTRRVTIAGPLDLVGGGRGLIVSSAVHRFSEGSGSEELWGLVSVVIDEVRFFESAGIGDDLGFRFGIRGRNGAGSIGDIFLGAADVFENDPIVERVSLPFGSWQIALVPVDGWAQIPANIQSIWRWITLIGALTVLIGVAFARLYRQREAAQRQLAQAIEAIDDGFALYDRNDRFVMCNSKYRELYSKSADLFVKGVPFEQIIRGGGGWREANTLKPLVAKPTGSKLG